MKPSDEPGHDCTSIEKKLDLLKDEIAKLSSVAVAFSSGVDSTLLLKVAHDVLGDNVVAITTRSASVPVREVEAAAAFCRDESIKHVVIETDEFAIEGFANNLPDRCYLCKREILAKIQGAARELGIETVAEGSNVDDDDDYRPGSRAVSESGAISPLRAAGLSKADVRALAKHLGLKVWNKPAYACLNTRFAYGEQLIAERLAMVEQAEYALHDEGFPQVRVRMQGDSARIEVPKEDIERLLEAAMRKRIAAKLHALGFAFVSLDLDGYRKGSMNETL